VLALLAEPAGRPNGGIVLVHGLGVNPDFGMIGALRGTLAEAGYVTLAVQMPVLGAEAPREDYAATFPEAGERIAAAVAFLRARGMTGVAIVSHSMGASMADAYLALPAAAKVDAWIPVGMLVPFTARARMPVLDVMAERDFPQVKDTAPGRKKALPADACSAQVTIADNDHYFERGDAALAAAITKFLARVNAGRC
jgi:alpha/beta superfamily hydrolase